MTDKQPHAPDCATRKEYGVYAPDVERELSERYTACTCGAGDAPARAALEADMQVDTERLETAVAQACAEIDRIRADRDYWKHWAADLDRTGDAHVARIAELEAELRQVREERDRLRSEVADAREACPLVRSQDYFDASLKTLIDQQISQLFRMQSRAEAAEAECQRLCEELEREQIRLAACTTAALGNTPEQVAQRIGPEHSWWSASYGDVCRAVDREIAHREALADLVAGVRQVVQEMRRWNDTHGNIVTWANQLDQLVARRVVG